ncbi:MAG: hypothetical protein F6K19_05385 [Cyanothece sp. SIO1E1]|nr:hypothetical protein [Cyanothece sp. SIO1E1]
MNGLVKSLILPSLITTSIASIALLPTQATATITQTTEIETTLQAEEDSPFNTELGNHRRHHHGHHDQHHYHAKKKKFFFGRR